MNITPPELPANLGIRGVGIDIEDVEDFRQFVYESDVDVAL